MSRVRSHIGTARGARPGAGLRAATLALLVLAAPLAYAHAADAAPAKVRVGAPTQRSFVANWDGDSDSTGVTVRMRRAGLAYVRVRNHRGQTVRVLVNGRLPRGATRVWWDGNDAAGTGVPPGDYRIEVRVGRAAQRMAAADAAHRAAPAAAPGNAASAAPVVVRAAPLTVSKLAATRGTIGARTGYDATRVAFTMSSAAWLSAVVADPRGHVVRTLWSGRRRAGRGALAWNGRTDGGTRAADGTYSVLLAGSGGGMPTNTMTMPLRVDTHPAVLTAGPRLVRGRVSKGRVVFTLPLGWNEAGVLTVRGPSGAGLTLRPTAGGSRRAKLDGRSFGIKPRAKATATRVRLQFVDAGGNVTTAVVTVAVKAQGSSKPATPVPPPPPTGGGGDPGSFIWPVQACFSSPFGQRPNEFHYGIDLAAPTGTPIHAARTGIVSYAGTMSGYGNIVILEHAGGYSTRYAHQSHIDVVVGQEVSQGQQIGEVGSTGHSTGPHLHFEVRLNGTAHDPVNYLPASGRPADC